MKILVKRIFAIVLIFIIICSAKCVSMAAYNGWAATNAFTYIESSNSVGDTVNIYVRPGTGDNGEGSNHLELALKKKGATDLSNFHPTEPRIRRANF